MAIRPPTKTALTHVTDASGLWYVHDGDNKNVPIPAQQGQVFCDLTRDGARRAKEFAVLKLKMRRAGVERQTGGAGAYTGSFGDVFGGGSASSGEGGSGPAFGKATPPAPAALAPDPDLQRIQQGAISAAAGAAREAQQRHDNLKRQQALSNPPPPPVLPELDPLDEIEGDGDGDDDLDLEDLAGIGTPPTSEDIEALAKRAQADAAKGQA